MVAKVPAELDFVSMQELVAQVQAARKLAQVILDDSEEREQFDTSDGLLLCHVVLDIGTPSIRPSYEGEL